MSTRHEVICWYTSAEWAKVKAISVDSDTMGSAFDKWLEAANALAERFESEGATVSKVHINADSLLAFARATKTDIIDRGVRNSFALERYVGNC